MLAMLAGGAQASELRILTWDSYLAPELLTRFEAETGIHPVVVTAPGYPEMLARLETAEPGIDVVNPADYQMDELIRRKLVQRIGAADLPHFFDIEDAWVSRTFDPENQYAIPFLWGTSSFVVDTAVYHGNVDTLSLMYNPPPELRGKQSFIGDGSDAVVGALIYLKLPRCTTDLADLAKVETLLRPLIREARAITTITSVIDVLSSPGVAIGMSWNGDAMRARERRPTLRYAYPPHGVQLWTDLLAVAHDAPNPHAARAFLTFMLRAENAALETNFTRYANSIHGSEAQMTQALQHAPEVVVPRNVSLDFVGMCHVDVMTAQQALLRRIIDEERGGSL
ncbi:MAG TPA: extracellular solute-binding protein [Patescibacteria group bacterium]|nr:extracellular solute-binding protein [Patescibacteria group bacterium]